MSEKWSDGAFAFLCAASVVIPLVGLITGSVCLKQEAKKTPGRLAAGDQHRDVAGLLENAERLTPTGYVCGTLASGIRRREDCGAEVVEQCTRVQSAGPDF